MKPLVRDYEGRTRDPLWERDLARQLRALHEPERLEFLNDLLSVHPVVALDLARKCLTDKNSFERLLERGLAEADASEIREWLDCVMPRLGFRHVLHCLWKQLPTNRVGVEKAIYWLPMFLAGSGCTQADVNALRAAA